MTDLAISTPAAYVTPQAVAFANSAGNALYVSQNSPLPVTSHACPATPLSGTTLANLIAGPYTPVIGRTVILALSGDWSGMVQLSRSTDGGATRQPITMGGAPWALFSTNCCESVWDESDAAARLYLEITLTSGTLTYRLSQ